jgi:hypothetical protein
MTYEKYVHVVYRFSKQSLEKWSHGFVKEHWQHHIDLQKAQKDCTLVDQVLKPFI